MVEETDLESVPQCVSWWIRFLRQRWRKVKYVMVLREAASTKDETERKEGILIEW